MQVPKDYIACNIEYFTLVKDVIVMKDNKCIKVKHGSYECKNDGSEITEDTVKALDDYKNWIAKRGVDE